MVHLPSKMNVFCGREQRRYSRDRFRKTAARINIDVSRLGQMGEHGVYEGHIEGFVDASIIAIEIVLKSHSPFEGTDEGGIGRVECDLLCEAPLEYKDPLSKDGPMRRMLAIVWIYDGTNA